MVKLLPHQTISKLFAENRGILAADESSKSANKRFAELKIDQTEQKRQEWRELLLESPNLSNYISGVILYDETIRQKDSIGNNFVDVLQKEDILTGIKVDAGLVSLPFFDPETITEGLDGLSDRLNEYKNMGASFTKWRSAFMIDSQNKLPTSVNIHANLSVMARYAAIVQSLDMVPIVEPEVLFDSNHDIRAAKDTTSTVLRVLFDLLVAYRVDISKVILKTSMILAGKQFSKQSTPEEVAQATLETLLQRVPANAGGVVFLSGGQTPEQATKNFNSICKTAKNLPWPLTFSFSRAVQQEAMQVWAGQEKNVDKAQSVFINVLKQNSLARAGKFE